MVGKTYLKRGRRETKIYNIDNRTRGTSAKRMGESPKDFVGISVDTIKGKDLVRIKDKP